jgi:DegV family protein with EDD domain
MVGGDGQSNESRLLVFTQETVASNLGKELFMSPVRIVTDSAADYEFDEAREAGVAAVVPLNIAFGTDMFKDRHLHVDEFWERAAKVRPVSSQPSVGEFAKVYREIIEAGDEVVAVTVTSKLSGTYNSACTAAQEFGDKVKVHDTWSVSWGQRVQVEAAIVAAEAGKSADEVVAAAQSVLDRLSVLFVLDTLDNLERGGRAAKLIAIVKKVVKTFGIKPILTFKEGELGLMGTATSFRRGTMRLLRDVDALGPAERLAVMHTRVPEEAAKFAARLSKRTCIPVEQIPITEIGAAVSIHGGPGLVGVAVVTKPTE